MNSRNTAIIQTVPAAAALRQVKGFEPLKYLRKAVSERTGEEVLRFGLPMKKLWFRLACPEGRLLLRPLRVTEQLAIYEASVYADRSANEPLSRVTASVKKEACEDGQYIEAAQDRALDEALENAGFGIQLCDIAETAGRWQYGTEIRMADIEQLRNEHVVGVSAVHQETNHPEVKASPAPLRTSNASVLSTGKPATKEDTAPALKSTPIKTTAVAEDSTKSTPPKPVQRTEAVEAPKQTAVSDSADPVKKVSQHAPRANPAENRGVNPSSLFSLLAPDTGAPENPGKMDASQKPAVKASLSEQTKPVMESKPVVSSLEQLRANVQRVGQTMAAKSAAKQVTTLAAAPDPMPSNTVHTVQGAYTPDMTVEEILSRMTLEEAAQMVVQSGVCRGWTLAQVAKDRTPSLRFYVNSNTSSNLLKAAARLALDNLDTLKAA